MKKNSKLHDTFKIRPTPGIEIDDISIGDFVEFTDPLSHGRHYNKVVEMTSKGKIVVIDIVKDKTNITVRNVRAIFKPDENNEGKYLQISLREVKK